MKASNIIKKNAMIFIMIILFIVFIILTGGRLASGQYMSELLIQNAYIPLLAAGMILCLICGGNVDISVGAVLCLSAALTAKLINMGTAPAISVLAAMLMSAAIGLLQGGLIGYVGLPSVLCTLAGMALYRSLAGVILSSGVIGLPQSYIGAFTTYIPAGGAIIAIAAVIAVVLFLYTFYNIGKQKKSGYMKSSPVGQLIKILIIDVVIILYAILFSRYQGFPVILFWVLPVIGLIAVVMTSTVFGRSVYAVGQSEKAAGFSGIDPRRIKFLVFFLSALLAGYSGIMFAGTNHTVNTIMGTSFEISALAACFIGGASVYGGTGSVQGAFFGAFLLAAVDQGMTVYGVSDQWKTAIRAIILLAALLFSVMMNKRKEKA